jgi:peptide/nickel transport system ATP-binding protein
LLRVRGLKIEALTASGPRSLVENVSLEVERGQTLCIAGESGSGKSMTALSLVQLLPRPAVRITEGTAGFKGKDLYRLTRDQIRQVRGREIGMIFQEPMTSLNPVLTVGRQLSEAILAHRQTTRSGVRAEAVRLLEQVRVPDARRRLAQYPFELSGGMRQRVMISIALSQKPDILIADEPTTALDVTVQAQILSLIRELQRDTGTAVILITHDLGVVAEMADRVLVLKQGRVVEAADVRTIFAAPRTAYTQQLVQAVPRLGSTAGTTLPRGAAGLPSGREIAAVDGLTVRFPIRRGLLSGPPRRVHAVEAISFRLCAGETLSLVGESGCGKSTTGRALMKLVPFEGVVSINGVATHDLTAREMKAVRRDVQMIFQDPFASLDPRMRVGELIGEPLSIHRVASGRELLDRVEYLVKRVGLTPDVLSRYPHEFSGGQRQRIVIARALSLAPKVIIADECVSALDVSIRAQVLELLQDLQNETGVAYLFISHDMAVVEQISHRVAVMYAGRIVEVGSRAAVFENPQHVYTRRLLSAVPIPDPATRHLLRPLAHAEPPTNIRPAGYEPPPATYREVGEGHRVLVDVDAFPTVGSRPELSVSDR